VLWRYVSVQAFMDLFEPLFRDRALPYHVVSLGLHGLNAALLFWLLSRRASKSAALIGAAFFAAHPAHFTALYWLSARADLLATTFALLTVLLALRRGRERWLAIPAFALSLLSKESTLLLPVVIALLGPFQEPSSRGEPSRRRLTAALAILSVLYGIYLATTKTGIAVGLDSQHAYAFDLGRSFLMNLLTYVGWTVDLAMLRPGLRFVDHQNPALFPLSIVVLVIAAALGLWPSLRRRGWLVGTVSFFLLLGPVLPLRNHTYRYYLYLPLMAASFCLALLVDAMFEALPGVERSKVGAVRRSVGSARRSALPIVAVLCWAALTWNGARLAHQMEVRPSPVYAGLRGDPIVDRALIAQRVIQGLRSASIPSRTDVRFIMRERLALVARIVRGSRESPPPAQEVYPETNVRTALFDGVGVRAMVPAIDSVTFALDLGAPMARWRYAVYAPTGETEVFDAASLDSLLRSDWVTRW
jgi:hypothetical protein